MTYFDSLPKATRNDPHPSAKRLRGPIAVLVAVTLALMSAMATRALLAPAPAAALQTTSITSIAFTNAPAGGLFNIVDHYYSIGSDVEVTATFGGDVTVTGTPRVLLTFGTEGTRDATYVSDASTATELVFRYTLVDGDSTGQSSLSLAANALDADGADGSASIQAGGADVDATHDEVPTTILVSAHRPIIFGAYVAQAPGVDADLDGTAETYVEGDTLNVLVRFNLLMKVDTKGDDANVQIVVDVGGTEYTLDFAGRYLNKIGFGSHTVKASDADSNGITIKRDGSNNLVRLSNDATLTSWLGDNEPVITAAADLSVTTALALDGQATPKVKVRGTNATPTGADFSKSTAADTDLTFTLADFAITDSDGDPLKEIRLTSLPTSSQGVLRVDGTAVASGDLPRVVARSELVAAGLVLDPASGFTGDTSFMFKVVDSFGAAAATANTATVSVAASGGSGSGGGDAPPVGGL
ncbi:MAG: Ig-like domain-containing protein [bacterium]|nr:Ig-like domain-containing protein [bacterium]MDE0602556.1 Ig-like domain-containing protein [bacterium]